MHTWFYFTNKAILACTQYIQKAFTGTVVQSSNQVSKKTLSWQEAHVDHIQSGGKGISSCQGNKGTPR